MRNTKKRSTKKNTINKSVPNATVTVNKYIPGACYGCQICLHCKGNNCGCDKSIKPKAYDNEKKRVTYSREFSPESIDNFCQEYLHEKKQTFNYDIDFSSTFSVYFCTKCHSKFCRIVSKNSTRTSTPVQTPETSSKESTTSPSPKKAPIVLVSPKRMSLSPSKVSSQPPIPTVMRSSPTTPITDDEYLPDLRFKLFVKKADNSALPQKWLNIRLTSYFNFMYDIEKQIKKMLNVTKLNKNDYNLSYQALNSRGLGTQLSDRDDWKEFLNDVEQMTKEKKTLLVNVFMVGKKRNEEDKEKNHNERYIYI